LSVQNLCGSSLDCFNVKIEREGQFCHIESKNGIEDNEQ
jgi:hypothetical protein